MTRLEKILFSAAGALLFQVGGLSQDAAALNAPAPLVAQAAGASAGTTAAALSAAQRAQDLGLSSLAVDLYRQARDMAGADRPTLTLALATALLDAGQPAEAEQALAETPEPRSASWHLRAGLAAVQLKKIDVARAELAAIKENELPVADYPWYWFFEGEMVDLAPVRELSRANNFYSRAEEAAGSELARARFQLAAERLRLTMNQSRDTDLKTLRENYDRLQGSKLGYSYAEYYAVALDAAGQRPQAISFLQTVLVTLPRQEREAWDRLRLVLGIMGDKSRTGVGRNALSQLVENGNDPLRQRQALELLAAASVADAERRDFRALLKKLIDARPDRPIKESLLFYRAQLALGEKDFAQAESDASELVKQFPLSPLRAHAFGVLTQSAWEQGRFRLAAVNAAKARAELQARLAPLGEAATRPRAPMAASATRARFDLGVLEAEAWFRAGLLATDRSDFRSAADAYDAVLRERPADVPAAKVGALMFQRVMAEIKADAGQAGKVLDQLAHDPALDLENRWQAEWSLARALQLQGAAGVKEAYARVTALLMEPAPGASTLQPALRARMAWLQAQLAFDAGDAAQAIERVDALVRTPLGIEPALGKEIASSAVLLKARAQFALGDENGALETLKKLRAEFSDSDSAIYSYLIEAAHYEDQGKIVEAQLRLTSLTDNESYKDSRYVPWALYQLALLSEKLGQEKNLRDANNRIEELVKHPAAGDLVFDARMKQGDIFRNLSEFPAAQQAYEELVNKYPRRPDIVYAQLALAKTHNAQSSSDPTQTHANNAQRLFEQLLDRVDAPRDVRVEAGYNLGKLLERRGQPEQAAKVWWQDVITPFLKEETNPVESDAKRPYWLARTLRELGELSEKLGRIDDAKAAYRLLLDKRLPYGAAVARARLEQFGMPATPKSNQ